ncbi:MAG: bifunctional hydroxymethylpyrimidine kinase/phosphomethylpyrimidine kinase [Lachnospiraceae bacterium]|nr:bifunctional hydroxymethylpyrimidine kinase/phosphomethylpyrimidine kinase [Lachnospiraceae bacterium]
MLKTALTIAGSDSGGGAGIQADIKTMTMNGVYASSAITALTAQNTTGVKSVKEVDEEFLKDQLDCVFTDIYPDAVKTGMIPNASLMKVIADALTFYKARNIVVDPVMVATSGASLMADTALDAMKKLIIPLATVITPNIPEAEALLCVRIESEKDMELAAVSLYETYGCAVLVKGGHGINDASDYLYSDMGGKWYTSKRIDNPNTHGTGCTLSSAIAAFLAKGNGLDEAIGLAKDYLTGAIADGLDLGKGSGPLNHLYTLNRVKG